MLSDVAALYSANVGWFAGSVFVLGLVVGSFLNVVIYRLPIILNREWQAQAAEFQAQPIEPPRDLDVTGTAATLAPVTCANPPAPAPVPAPAPAPEATFTLSVPRSACPNCKAPITALRNIPLVSWLVLRGRCASCHTPISIRYPLVELATGVLSAWVAWHFGFGVSAACGIAITWALIALAGIDIDHQLLPDDITLPLLWAGLLAAVVFGPGAGSSSPMASLPMVSLPVSPRDAIIGAAAGYLSLWLVFHTFKWVTGKEGMGYGDFKLFGALGAWLGWKLLPLVILLSAATGAALGIALILLRGRDRAAPMPFGPYLAAAGWLAMMYGESIMNTYLRLSGLQH